MQRRKRKRDDMGMNSIEISLKMKNKGWLSTETNITKMFHKKRLVDILFWLAVVREDFFSFHTNK